MSNLTNVYANLRRVFPEVDMLFAKPVSYLKTLAGTDFSHESKVVFAFKEDQNQLKTQNSYTEREENDKSSSLNLTGSPLKDDLSIDELINHSIANKIFLSKPWKNVEETYTPVDVSVARKILMAVKDSHGWIFILCNNQTCSDGTFLLSCNDKIRGIASYHGVVKHSEKKLEELISRHYSMISRNTKLDIQIESFFEVTSDITLKFRNKTFSREPSIDHIDDLSEAFLYQRVEIGKCHVLCEDFWSQIQLLNAIKSDILNSRDDPTYSYGSSDMTFENLQPKVNRILSEVNVIQEELEVGAEVGLEDVIKRARVRSLSEITDQLWDLLKFTSSYNDLKKIITLIFQIASRTNIVNIPTNNNRLGELIRELCQQRLAIPYLVGTEPLELLLEIGIEKLMKDYEFIFSESKICKLNEVKFGSKKSQSKNEGKLSVRKSLAASIDLNSSTSSRKTLLKTNSNSLDNSKDDDDVRNSRFNERDVEMSISKLAQIHLVVEHLLLIQNNLTIDNDYTAITKKLFEKPLVLFDDLQSQKFDKFEFPISDKKVSSLVEQLMPNAQKITLQSGNKFKEVKNVFYYNIEQIVPALVKKDKEEIVKEYSFHFISYATINSKI